MSVKKNFAYNMSYQILIMILPLITTPYISRVIGAEGIGLQSYTFSIVNYFMIFIRLGINNHGNRSIAISRDSKYECSKTFINIYSVQLFMAVLMSIVYIVYVMCSSNKYRVLFIIQYIHILSALLDINWFFFGLEKFKLTVTRNTIIKIISVASIFIFVKNQNDLYKYSFILAIAQFISQLILWPFLLKEINLTKPSVDGVKEHIKPILILFIPVIAISIYNLMDKIMIGLISNMVQLGLYENSEKIIAIPVCIITALGTVMLPKMSNMQIKGNNKESQRYISLSMDFAMLVSIGSVFGLIGVSPNLIPILLGEEFKNAVNLVSILSISVLFLSWANVIRTQFLIPNKRDKVFVKSTIYGAIVNLICNLLFIPRFGAMGAVVGTVLAETIVALYQTLSVRNELDIREYFSKALLYIIPGMIMYFVVRYIGLRLSSSVITLMIQVGMGLITYLSITLIIMSITRDKLLMNIVHKYKMKKESVS